MDLHANQQDTQSGLTHMTGGMLGIKHRSEAGVSVLSPPFRLGVQEDPEWATQYCFTIGTLWCWRNQEMLKVRLLAEPFLGAEVWWNQCRKGWQMSGRSNGARVLPLVL